MIHEIIKYEGHLTVKLLIEKKKYIYIYMTDIKNKTNCEWLKYLPQTSRK